jgi:hypothetical protein
MSVVQKEGEPMLIKAYALQMQVCVPKEWDDTQVKDFAEKSNPCGTKNGWFIQREGDERLKGDPERAQCVEHGSHCHIMLNA